MKRGISFIMPNKYGTFLSDLLSPIDISAFTWQIGDGESYKIIDHVLGEDLFPVDKKILAGTELGIYLKMRQYIIFADLKGFRGGGTETIETYERYLTSNCEFVLLVVDSCYVTIYCKNTAKLQLLHDNARTLNFQNVEYITDENDTSTSMIAW
ncbi:DUF2691 family protein [Rossellomorea vietnamensis]|uniref:DUF2691 family protein n=1 Tax=Rossellomorea vietnamensis TaxID=218284 RepID=UPI003CF2D16A